MLARWRGCVARQTFAFCIFIIYADHIGGGGGGAIGRVKPGAERRFTEKRSPESTFSSSSFSFYIMGHFKTCGSRFRARLQKEKVSLQRGNRGVPSVISREDIRAPGKKKVPLSDVRFLRFATFQKVRSPLSVLQSKISVNRPIREKLHGASHIFAPIPQSI